jgi:hypothetical protein
VNSSQPSAAPTRPSTIDTSQDFGPFIPANTSFGTSARPMNPATNPRSSAPTTSHLLTVHPHTMHSLSGTESTSLMMPLISRPTAPFHAKQDAVGRAASVLGTLGTTADAPPAWRIGVVGASGFEPATFRPQPSGFRRLCVSERPSFPMCPGRGRSGRIGRCIRYQSGTARSGVDQGPDSFLAATQCGSARPCGMRANRTAGDPPLRVGTRHRGYAHTVFTFFADAVADLIQPFIAGSARAGAAPL